MDVRWGRCAALTFVTTGLVPSASAQTATAGVTAEIVAPSELGEAAAEWLISNSPGVFMLRIPGTAQAPAITIKAQAPDANSGTIEFLASSEGGEALRDLLTQISSSAATGSAGVYQLSGATADGTVNAQGIQLILVSSAQNGEGGGLIVAIIAFD